MVRVVRVVSTRHPTSSTQHIISADLQAHELSPVELYRPEHGQHLDPVAWVHGLEYRYVVLHHLAQQEVSHLQTQKREYEGGEGGKRRGAAQRGAAR